MMNLILFAQLLGEVPAPGTPPPPPAPQRTELPPEYVADCQVMDPTGRIARLTVEVKNFPQPNGRVVHADRPLAYLKSATPVMSRVSMPDEMGGWDMSDTIMMAGSIRGDVAIRVETRNREAWASVSLITLDNATSSRAYEAGMCRVRVTR